MNLANPTAGPSATDRPARDHNGDAPGGPLRVLLVGENASMTMGGEASFPYLYFKLLRGRGVEVFLACHARVREELRELLGDEFERVGFVEEFPLNVALWRVGQWF